MYDLPTEVVDRIVRFNKDSVRTIISCMEIFNKKFITDNEIGIIVLTDDSSTIIDNLFKFKLLINENQTNLFHWPVKENEDKNSKFLELVSFMVAYDHILVVIFTKTTYNENLTVCMNKICYSCNINTTISVFYKTPINYVSKLYFNEFKRNPANLNMSELYILGNLKVVDNLCDIDTLFRSVYLFNIKCCYSLQIDNYQRKLIAPNLITIRKLIYNSDVNVSNINDYLKFCPNLSNIYSMKFPINNESTKISILPHCDNICLNDFNNDASYSQIDGTKIRQSLTLSTTLRTVDTDFKYLRFPNIRTLVCNSSHSNLQTFNFISCQFANLKNLECNNSVIPWKSFSFDNSKVLDTVSIKLSNMKQLLWVTECPFKIKLIKFFFKNGFNIINNSRLNDIKFNICDELFLEIQELQFCVLLNKIIIPNLKQGNISKLNIKINENNLKRSMLENTKNYKELGISEEEDVKFEFSNLKKLTLMLDNKDFVIDNLTNKDYERTQKHNSNPFQDILIPGYNFYSIAPSQFRKNSLAGLSETDARKQSIISIDSSYERRLSLSNKSDIVIPSLPGFYNNESAIDDSYDDFISINLIEKLPEVIKTDLFTLKSGILNFKSLKDSNLSLLQINLLPDFVSTDEIEKTELELTNDIITIFGFPFKLNLPYTNIERLQIVVDMRPFIETITIEQRSILLDGIKERLLAQHYYIDVYDNSVNRPINSVGNITVFLQY